MTKGSKKHLERLGKVARKFIIFLYKKFGREDFTYSTVKKEVSKISFRERQQQFGCYNEKQLSNLYNKFEVLERRPYRVKGKKIIHSYNLKEEICEEVEILLNARAKNNYGVL